MLTDATPRKASHAAFLESDRIRTLDLPQDGCLLPIAKCIESAMKNGTSADVRRACAEFLNAASGFYKVPACAIRACGKAGPSPRKLEHRAFRRLQSRDHG